MLLANCNGLPLQQVLATTTETLNSLTSQPSLTTLGAVDYTTLDSSSDSSSSSDDYDYGSTGLLGGSTLDDYVQSQQQYYAQNMNYVTEQQLQQQQQLQNTLGLSLTQEQLQQQQLQNTLNPSSLPNGISPLDNELYTQTVGELNYEAADQTQNIINHINVDYNDSNESS